MGGAQRDSRRKRKETETRLDSHSEGWRLKGEGQRAEKKRKQRDTQRQKRNPNATLSSLLEIWICLISAEVCDFPAQTLTVSRLGW